MFSVRLLIHKKADPTSDSSAARRCRRTPCAMLGFESGDDLAVQIGLDKVVRAGVNGKRFAPFPREYRPSVSTLLGGCHVFVVIFSLFYLHQCSR